MNSSAIPPAAVPVRPGDAPGVARVIAMLRADAAAGNSLDVTSRGERRDAVPVADRPASQPPPVVPGTHSRSPRAAADDLGKPDFGKALRHWLDLERDRVFGEISSLDQVQAKAPALTERERGVEPGAEPAGEHETGRATEPRL